MSTSQTNDTSQQLVIRANYELFVIGMILLQLFNSILLILGLDPDSRQVLILLGIFIGLFLMFDAVHRLLRTPQKRTLLFEYHGWLIFLGSLPIPFLVLARLLWYLVVGVKLRRSDYFDMEQVVIAKRAQSTLLLVIFGTILMLEMSSLLILRTEGNDPASNIRTGSDALWWTLVTIATVGYGDRFPVTAQGRIVGILTMLVGVGLFTVLTSFLAQWFLNARRPARRERLVNLTNNADLKPDLRSSLVEVQDLLAQYEVSQQTALAELNDKLAEIEAGLKRLEK